MQVLLYRPLLKGDNGKTLGPEASTQLGSHAENVEGQKSGGVSPEAALALLPGAKRQLCLSVSCRGCLCVVCPATFTARSGGRVSGHFRLPAPPLFIASLRHSRFGSSCPSPPQEGHLSRARGGGREGLDCAQVLGRQPSLLPIKFLQPNPSVAPADKPHCRQVGKQELPGQAEPAASTCTIKGERERPLRAQEGSQLPVLPCSEALRCRRVWAGRSAFPETTFPHPPG